MNTKRFLAAVALWVAVTPLFGQSTMTAHFVDVGQGHATLLEFPCGAVLVDAGGDSEHGDALVNYLTTFFQRRTDLQNTLELVLITHNHKDHTQALRPVVETFTVRRFVDNGFTTGSGSPQTNWLRREVEEGRRTLTIRDVSDNEITTLPDKNGLADETIDPIQCSDIDPQIRVLSGRFDENPGWPEGEFENQNNHSLVTRVDFGEASFLFMGDMESDGIELLVDYYGPDANGILDADVLQVGHHGSHNATTAELLHAVTPLIAVIPVGRWTFGKDPPETFSTYAFGHPRKVAVDLLKANITRKRTPSKSVKVATKAKKFQSTTVSKAIYANGWDGTVRVVATRAGKLTAYREQ